MKTERAVRLQRLQELEQISDELLEKIRAKHNQLRAVEASLGQGEFERESAAQKLLSTVRREERLINRIADVELNIALVNKRQELVAGDEVPDGANIRLELLETEKEFLSKRLAGVQESRQQLARLVGGSLVDIALKREELKVVTEVAASLRREVELQRLELHQTQRVASLGDEVTVAIAK